MIRFDWMRPYGFNRNRLYFKSQTCNKYYYFEFSWKFMRNIISDEIKYIGIPRLFRLKL